MVTFMPFLARNAEQVSPAGPPPITATFFPTIFLLISLNFGILYPSSIPISPIVFSTNPISTGSPLIPLIQDPWHCFACGQILPQIAGSTVVLHNISKPFLLSFS